MSTEQSIDPIEVNARIKELIRQRDDYANRLVSAMGTLTKVVYERDELLKQQAGVPSQPSP